MITIPDGFDLNALINDWAALMGPVVALALLVVAAGVIIKIIRQV